MYNIPAGKFATEAVVYLNARSVFQEYLIVPTAPVTVPAVTEPVLVPKQVASDLVELKLKAVAGCPTVTN
jgi:hypothetical protein